MTKFTKKWRRCISVFLILMLLVPQAVFGQGSTDVQSHWAYEIMSSLAKDGIFSPMTRDWDLDAPITRQEFVRLVNRAFGFNVEGDAVFTDLSPSSPYYKDVATAVQIDLMSGYPGGFFKPEGSITRQEAAVVLSKVTHKENVVTGVVNAFSDGNDIPAWSQESMAWMIQEQYLNGYEDGTIGYDREITYGEALALIDNILGMRVAEEVNGSNITLSENVLVLKPNVNVRNMKINGDLIIGGQVGDGDVTLENVVVNGRLIVYGGGLNSIKLLGSEIKELLVSRFEAPVRVYADENSVVSNSKVEASSKLESPENVAIFKTVSVVPKGQRINVELDGDFESVSIEKVQEKNAEDTVFASDNDSTENIENEPIVEVSVSPRTVVRNLDVDEKATVEGEGKVEEAQIKQNDVNINVKINDLNLDENVETIKVQGEEHTSETSASNSARQIASALDPAESDSDSGGSSSSGSSSSRSSSSKSNKDDDNRNEPVVDPDEPTVDPEEPIVDPEEPIVDPEEPIVDPEEPIVDPEEPIVDPEEPIVDPDEPIVDPEEPLVDPEEPIVDPDEPIVDPDEPIVDPDELIVDPEDPSVNPDEPTNTASGVFQFGQAPEPAEEGTTVRIPIVRTGGTIGEVVVTYEVLYPGNADMNDFYSAEDKYIIFESGIEEQEIEFEIISDLVVEGDEYFQVRLVSPSDMIGDFDSVNVLIEDMDEAKIEFSEMSMTVDEGDTLSFDLKRLGELAGEIQVSLSIEPPRSGNSVSLSDLDIDDLSFVTTMLDGYPSGRVVIPIREDQLVEGDERFNIEISEVSPGSIGTISRMEVTIIDQTVSQDSVSFDANVATVSEGDILSVTLIREGNLLGSMRAGLLIGFDGIETPAENADFDSSVSNPILVDFSDGDRTKTIEIPIASDMLAEGNEQFKLYLDVADGVLGEPSELLVTVVDETLGQDEITLRANSVVQEGGQLVIELLRKGSLKGEAMVDLNIGASRDANTASIFDFESEFPYNEFVVFEEGRDLKTVVVTIANDKIVEADEVFEVQISDPTNCILGDSVYQKVTIDGIDFIIDPVVDPDESVPSTTQPGVFEFGSDSDSVDEGQTISIPIVRTGGAEGDIVVSYEVIFTGNADLIDTVQTYSYNVLFENGVTERSIEIGIWSDSTVEGDEYFQVRLVSPSDMIGTQDTFTVLINDMDDATIEFPAESMTVNEGDTLSFDLQRQGAVLGEIQVELAIIVPRSEGAASTSDFGINDFRFYKTMREGYYSERVDIPISNDQFAEGDETFIIVVSKIMAGALVEIDRMEVTIVDQTIGQDLISLQADSVVREGEALTFRILRNGSLKGEVLVSYSVTATGESDSAQSEDFELGLPIEGIVLFGEEEFEKSVNVLINRDRLIEGDESFEAKITDIINGLEDDVISQMITIENTTFLMDTVSVFSAGAITVVVEFSDAVDPIQIWNENTISYLNQYSGSENTIEFMQFEDSNNEVRLLITFENPIVKGDVLIFDESITSVNGGILPNEIRWIYNEVEWRRMD